MKKAEKVKVTFNFRKTTAKDLSKFCEASGTWNASVFADVAVAEKIARETKKGGDYAGV